MKIAFSADLHLTSQTTHPERFHALEEILKGMLAEDIQTTFGWTAYPSQTVLSISRFNAAGQVWVKAVPDLFGMA